MHLEHDTVQNFIFDNHPVRGEIVRLDESFQTILSQHYYPPVIRQLLAEALVAVSLLNGMSKQRGKLTLQFQGNGPLTLLSVRCTHDYHLRGVVQWNDEMATPDSLADALGQGVLLFTHEPDEKGQRYQSVVEVTGHSVAKAIEDYYVQSEQLGTRIILTVNEKHAAGLMLQQLPSEDAEAKAESWNHVLTLAETLTPDELLELDNHTLLHRLYNQEIVRVFTPHAIQFGCSCSVYRMENALIGLGKEEALEILLDRDSIEVTCEFCNHHYDFDRVDVERLFTVGGLRSDSNTKH
ncbi:MAG: Hsp33 family molecular chaperone HslO [Gammaproteobacteria bacterium]|nr:Hsp33 family molecular chaperone HslO [Gammaproteobacteria bacterium]